MSGTLSGKFSRKSTETSEWTTARDVAIRHAEANSWIVRSALETIASQPPSGLRTIANPPATPTRATIRDACTAYYVSRESRGLAEPTLAKYRTFTKQLTAFAEGKGYVMVDQFTISDIDVFWATWKLGGRTKAKRLTTLRGFFRFCMYRK